VGGGDEAEVARMTMGVKMENTMAFELERHIFVVILI
jgi:hypothetical protein